MPGGVNILSDGVHAYGYDARNRLTRLNDGQFTYRINAQGLRVCKESLSEPAVYFTYDESGQLIGEYDASGNAIRETVWLGNIPVAVVASGSVYYTYADHLNTPRLIENANGTAVWKWNLDPFGTLPPDEDPDGDGVSLEYNLRFPGQYFDQESGLHYNWHRYYDPNIGRYLRPDPIGLEGGINLFTYVKSNPIKYKDSQGLKKDWCGSGLTSFLVPENPCGFDISDACRKHDMCYATKQQIFSESHKSKCDKELKDNIKDICRMAYSNNSGCLTIADRYYWGVHYNNMAMEAYLSAQVHAGTPGSIDVRNEFRSKQQAGISIYF